MERILGRPLRDDETVHHKNGLRKDNRPANLELWSKRHGAGQRVEDKVKWCVEFIRSYPEIAVGFDMTVSAVGGALMELG